MDLIDLINKLVEVKGKEAADNIIAGMLILKPNYFSLRETIIEVLDENGVKVDEQ